MAFGKRKREQRRAAQSDRDALFDEEFLKKLEYLYLISRKIFAGQSRAERKTRKVGSGIEFADHRDYTMGDDFRYIDWNVLGRTDRMLLRLFEEEEDLYIYLLIDCSESMSYGAPPKVHYAMQVAAALAYVGLANLDRVSLVNVGDGVVDRLPPARGKGRIFKVFEFLRNTNVGGPTALQSALKTFVAQNKRRGIAVLLSDYYAPEGYQEAINVLRYNKFEPLAIQVVDPKEGEPQLRGDLRLVDCESGDTRDITVSNAMLEAFKREHAAYCKELEEFCASKQVPFFTASTDTPFDELVLRIFRRGGFLR